MLGQEKKFPRDYDPQIVKINPGYQKKMQQCSIISVDDGNGTMVNVFAVKLEFPSLVLYGAWLADHNPWILGTNPVVNVCPVYGGTSLAKLNPDGSYKIVLEAFEPIQFSTEYLNYSDLGIDGILLQPGDYLLPVADDTQPDVLLTANRAFDPATEIGIVCIYEKVGC